MATDTEQAAGARSRRPLSRRRSIVLGLALLLLVAALAVWTQRREIADDFVARELDRRGVKASYRLTGVGPRAQRIENLVIGDPRRPDLVARVVEVRVRWGLAGPRLGLVTARGVRLRGRVTEGRLSFGEVDKLLPPPSGKPFAFPDLDIDLADAALILDTPAGRIAAAIEGRGNLSGGFRGAMAARAPELTLAGCTLAAPRLDARIGIAAGRPSIEGPAGAARLSCAAQDLDLAGPRLDLDVTVTERLDGWLGNAGVSARWARVGGAGAEDIGGRFSLAGDAATTRGTIDLAAARISAPDTAAGRTRLTGRYAVSPATGAIFLLADASARSVRVGARLLSPAGTALRPLSGTPLAPLGAALAAAMRRAGDDFGADASFRFVNAAGVSALRVERLASRSRSGAGVRFEGGEGATLYLSEGAMRVDGAFSLSGGGFPALAATLSQPLGALAPSGEVRVAPFVAGGAHLALAPIRFRPAGRGATRVETALRLSGPLGDGRVDDLELPVAGSFGPRGFAFGEGCVTVRFRALSLSGLRLAPARLPLCPTGRALVWRQGGGAVQGGGETPDLRLAGRLGSTPVTLAAAAVSFDIARTGFAATRLAGRLGEGDYVNRLDAARIEGRVTAQGVAGTFAGLDGKIANVPLLIGDGRGDWSLAGGRLALAGALTVADANDPPRFFPLGSNDFALSLAGNRIDARGTLTDPERGVRIADVSIFHDLGIGTGHATLAVPGLVFAPDGYQPDDLTRLTTGVVALVDGTVTGTARIDWSPEATTSTGTFATADMGLAAPFGPVEGLATTVEFTDLLGLASAPGQLASTRLIRTGIDVVDGAIRFQLLPGLKVRVEAGRWPFMGGTLTLDETILDFSEETVKRLTFRVEGADAAIFVQRMEFGNIAATGTFDGVVPMAFDQSGGRIVGGRLAARPTGGTLSYVGVVTEAQLGAYGKLAFDALKSLRYDKFTIALDGLLDGEFLAGIELDGIARDAAPAGGITGYVLGQLARIPFEFNIRIRGPFRALIGTARSFEDPSLLIQPLLPDALRDLPISVVAEDRDEDQSIQPQESEVVP